MQELRFIKRPVVLELTGLSKSQMYRLIKSGEFPKPRRIGIRSVAWLLCDIRKWQLSKLGNNDDLIG